MGFWRERGCFSDASGLGWGFATYDAVGWMLTRGHGVWRIRQPCRHHWINAPNARTVVGVGANGHREQTEVWVARGIFPAQALDYEHLLVGETRVRCAP
jgi:hypothetical protein